MMQKIALLAPSAVGHIAQPLRVRNPSFTYDWVIRYHEEAKEKAKATLAPDLAIYEARDIVISGSQHIIYIDGAPKLEDGFCLDFVRTEFLRARPQRTGNIKILQSDNRTVIYQSHGVAVYGHVLVDMLPRLAMLKLAGYDLASLQYLVQTGTPQWHLDLLNAFFGIQGHQLVWFDWYSEMPKVRAALIPTLPRGQGGMHPAAALLFDVMTSSIRVDVVGSDLGVAIRRPESLNPNSFNRTLSGFNEFAGEVAAVNGCRFVEPSTLSVVEQIAMFRSTSVILGEYGSALHNVVFSRRQPVCICIGHINLLQSALCAMRGAPVVYFSLDLLAPLATLDVMKCKEFLIQVSNEFSVLQGCRTSN